MKESRSRVLIVDDEPLICQLLDSELGDLNYICKTVFYGKDALRVLKKESFDLVLLDIKLPDMSGIYILGQIMKAHPRIPVIMITGVLDIDTAVLAMKIGALDYIVKPFDLNKLTASVNRTILNSKSRDTGRTGRRKAYLDNTGKEEAEDPIIKELDAICQGVEDRVDDIIGSSKIITERTVQIARRLQIPEGKIRSWKEERRKSIPERNKLVYSSRTEEKQKFLSCAIMNTINLLIDKDLYQQH